MIWLKSSSWCKATITLSLTDLATTLSYKYMYQVLYVVLDLCVDEIESMLVQRKQGQCWSRPNNLTLVCLYLSLYISFLLFGHLIFFNFFISVAGKKNVQIIKRKYIIDKYKHTRDRLFGLMLVQLNHSQYHLYQCTD